MTDVDLLLEGPENDKVNILVVDDLPDKLLVLETILDDLGENLVMVRSGREALREVLNRDFAVILLDVNMPDIDGLETASLIRQYKRSAHTPIIFITAFADEMQTSRGYSLGAVDYIFAPVIPEVLRTKVAVFVELHRMHRRMRSQAEERVALARAELGRKLAEDATQRAAFLAQASRVLSGSLDSMVGMHRLVELLVPRMADFAALMLRDLPQQPDVLLMRVAERASGQVRTGTYTPWAGLPPPIAQAMQKALDDNVMVSLHEAELSGVVRNEEAASGLCRAVAVPLSNGDAPLGVMLLGMARGRQEDMLDRATLDELAGRAAMAFENARLYRDLEMEIEVRTRAEEKLHDANRRKDEFLAMLSHELRNPLAPIRNAVEVMRQVELEDERVTWARDVVDRQVSHLARLVEELLDVLRIGQGKVTLQREPVNLSEVIHHGIETARPLIDARRHTLQVNLQDAQVWLLGDFARLSQVTSNLLNNAAKYTEEGGHIELSASARDGIARIVVRDNGMGIEGSLLPHIFDLFSQGERSLDRSQGGLGVGLTLVQRLVELHNGQVEARSAGKGAGSEFIVTLPCINAVPRPVPALAAARPPSAFKVLVVDDNEDAAASVSLFLELQGHTVCTVHDGNAALRAAEEFGPEVVVLDIGLPGISGYEVARRLRALPAFEDALLVAMTGYGQKEDQAEAAHAGFDHHLIKPANPKELLGIIGDYGLVRAACARTAAR